MNVKGFDGKPMNLPQMLFHITYAGNGKTNSWK